MTSEKFRGGRFTRTNSTAKTDEKHSGTVPSRSDADYAGGSTPQFDRAEPLFEDPFASGPVPSSRPFAQARSTKAGKPTAAVDSLVALATAVRWGTTTVGLLWAAALRANKTDLALGVVLLAYALWRTYQPVRYRRRGWKSLLSIMSELAIAAGVVVASGCWESPYIFALFTPVIAAGFARGFWHAFRIGITGAVAVGLAAFLLNLDNGIRPITAWSGEFLLVAAVASYGSRLLARAEEVGVLNLTQVWRLNEANSLLVSLNRLAHDMPVSFDFQETVANTLKRVREVAHPDLSALLLLEPLSSVWSVALAEGARLPESYLDDQLPHVVVQASTGSQPKIEMNLGPQRPGLRQSSRSGIYVPLWAGDRQIGLLAVESDDNEKFGLIQVEMLRELAEPMALTIDNARWFDRLRARGAAQERNRIARDLHDRVGQGVAYVAFELDRLSTRADGTALAGEINQLRTDARAIVSELRETLYDLRTDVSDERALEVVVAEFLTRVAKRSSLQVSFDHNAQRRLALSQEREVWRICQEAIVNVERHADASAIGVVWKVDDLGGALLTVTDNGVGIASVDGNASGNHSDSASPGRPSYGLTGMRERAESIGGLLEIAAGRTGGTTVRLAMGTQRGRPSPFVTKDRTRGRSYNNQDQPGVTPTPTN